MDEPSIRMIGLGFTVGTCAYSPTPSEKMFYDRLREDARRTLQSKRRDTTTERSTFTLKGHVGQFVSWFGIVRRIDRSTEARGGTLLVENKYFADVTDCHIQTVEIAGAGDFEVELSEIPDGLIPLILVRVYGHVAAEHSGRPLVTAEYMRVWHWGQFNFSDLFGEDHGNAEWKKRMNLPKGEDVYRIGVSRKYYVERLGPTADEWEEIAAWHRGQTEIEASDEPYEPKQGTAEYAPTEWEQRYFKRLFEKDRATIQSKPWETEHAKFQLRGHLHQFVSWFGVVREAIPYIHKSGGMLLVENKYFKGSGDQRLQTVSIRGGGDFKAELTHFSKDIEPLTLVRVYGSVLREEGDLPVVEVAYVRVWACGQYNFDDYGVDRTNARWTKNLRLESGERVYAPQVSADYYIKRLAPTDEQAKKIREQFEWEKQREKRELENPPPQDAEGKS